MELSNARKGGNFKINAGNRPSNRWGVINGHSRCTHANSVEDDELCAMFDESSQCTIVLPEECLGYGLVVPFLACRFALWFRIMKT